MAKKLKEVDAVIVGLGWTGGILAKELTEAGLKVMALERGAMRDTRNDYSVPGIRDELRYVVRHDLMQNTARDTLTVRNHPSQEALPMRRLDPKTGAVTEFPFPEHKPGFPTGFLGLRSDREGNLWLGNMYQATIVRFDRNTRTFRNWTLPHEQNIDAAQINMVSPQSSHVDGKVWSQNNGFAGVHRLDVASGRMETWEPFKTAPKGEPHNI